LRFALALVVLAVSPAHAAVPASVPQDAGERAPAVRGDEEGYAVRLDGEVVLRVKTALGPITAEQRAALAEARLNRVANDPFYSAELFRVEVDEQEGRIYYRGELVGSVTRSDAAAKGLAVEEACAEIVAEVRTAIQHYRERRRPGRLLTAGLFLAGATLLAVLLVLFLRRTHRRMAERVQEGEQTGLARKLKERLGVPPQKVTEYRLRFLRLGRNALVLLVVLAWLQAAFGAVPMTRGYAMAVLQYLLDPVETLWQGFLAHVGDLFFILVVLILSRYLLKFLRWLAGEARTGSVRLPGIEPESALSVYKIVRLVVIAFAAMIVYPYIPGSSSAAFKGISLFGGALFTLGASGTVGNFIGGIVLVFMGHYRLGDRIRLGDVIGDVTDMSLLVTRIRTPKNEVVSIPNAAIMGGQLVNYSKRAREEGLILHTSVTIGYDTPWRRVHELLLAAARRTDGLLESPAPFVLQTQLADFFVGYELNAHTRLPNDMPRLYSDLHQNIQDEFNRAGVQIMSPHYVADPAEPKVARLE